MKQISPAGLDLLRKIMPQLLLLLACLLLLVIGLFSGLLWIGDMSEGWGFAARLALWASFAAILLVAGVLGSAIIVLQGVSHNLDKHQQALQESEVRNRQIAKRVQAVREAESRRVAVWLHDEVGQLLTRARMDLMMMEGGSVTQDPSSEIAFISVKQIVDDVLRMVRHISVDLRPPILDDFGLVAALEWSMQEDGKRLPIRFTFDADAVPEPLHPDLAIGYYRMARECLTNVARHAQAKAVTLRLYCEHGELVMVVSDDGRGMPQGGDQSVSIGLSQLHERADVLDGTVQIDSQPGRGTCVTIRSPIRMADKEDKDK